ncbi:DNA-processing protein DprA [Azotosporobacter soli]|uniref:DNA-processing protein DprA n=1 Tax=Azotosporobacter soli TaxID=3055040 RepID=UPI0031FF20AC
MERWYRAALQGLEGIGQGRMTRLIAYFGSAQQAWLASREDWGASGCVPAAVCEALPEGRRFQAVEELASSMEKQGIRICLLEDEDYPVLLRHICRPPLLFYYYGRLPKCDRTMAVVGTRKASNYGCNAAKKLAEELAREKFWVISGAARGIDAAAHRGALSGGGQTLAVLGCSINTVYPAEHRQLLKQIVDGGGGVISEYPPGTPLNKGHFPARNRIISGLSRGVVVVEAAQRSGALITADFALEEGRDVFAVPGSIFSSTSQGTHQLIEQGAKLTSCVQDILAEYGESSKRIASESEEHSLQGMEATLYNVLSYEEAQTTDEIIMRTGLPAPEAAHGLLLLELRGFIAEQEGKRYIRVAREGIR